MLKRIGVLAFVLTAGVLFQPAAVFAADWNHGNAANDRREPARVETVRAVPSRERVSEGARRDDRAIRRDDRVVVETAPAYYYAPASNCAYGR